VHRLLQGAPGAAAARSATNNGFDGEPNSLYNHAFSRKVCGKMNSDELVSKISKQVKE
jgi:hypothetical protein